MTQRIVTVLALYFLVGSVRAENLSPVQIDALTCEHLSNPIGIGNQIPAPSWKLRSDRNGEVQTAWEIRAASSDWSDHFARPLGFRQSCLSINPFWFRGPESRSARARRFSGRSGSGTRTASPRPGATWPRSSWDCWTPPASGKANGSPLICRAMTLSNPRWQKHPG